ncbi:MAG TPA: hypothetical protein VG227_03970 [Caulobacteraceae bacterium]|jgi:hypothetical protein|nr:hypothetical protein [Caulobacteraceae bacterium]
MISRAPVIFFLAAALALAGCAKVGTLDRPAPLFGEKAKAKYRAEKAAAAAAKTAKTDEGEPEPLPDVAPQSPPGPSVQPVQPPAAEAPTLPPASPQ